MGIAAALFFSANDSEKQTLLRRITPTEQQFEEQQDRWNALADHLLADLRARSGCAMRSWLQGSYKFGTQVRPPGKGEEFDIDLGIYFEWRGGPEEGDHDPAALRAMVQASLGAYAGSADGVREVVRPPKPRCCRVHYANGFHIDVPCYHLNAERDARRLAAGGGWEESDPKALYTWWKGKLGDARRAKARRQVRYLKCWASLKFKPDEGRPSSVLLTVLVAEAIASLADAELAADDDALREIVGRIIARLDRKQAVPNPVDGREDLNRLGGEERDRFLLALRELHDVAVAAWGCETEVEAALAWSGAFGHFFPMPEVGAATLVRDATAKAALAVAVVAPVTLPDVFVTATPSKNPLRVYRGTNSIGPIPKDCDLVFQVADVGKLPPDTTVEWVVRNGLGEAEDVNDLGHRAGTGVRTTERSAYRGTHFMDCTFRRGGRTIGVRRVRVEVTGTAMPARNPAKRPSWVALRGLR